MKIPYDNIEYQISLIEDRHIIQRAVVAHLSKKHWLGFNEKIYFQQFVEQTLKPRAKKIIQHIWQKKLCHITFLKKLTHEEAKNLVRGKYDTVCVPPL